MMMNSLDPATAVGAGEQGAQPPWLYRPPPRGLIPEEYQLCPEMIASTGSCLIADQCTLAHSAEELAEWRRRFNANMEAQKRQAARQPRPLLSPRLNGSSSSAAAEYSFSEELLQKWLRSGNPETVMTERLPFVVMTVKGDAEFTLSTKAGSTSWFFHLSVAPPRRLRRVALLQDSHRRHFRIKSVHNEGPRSYPTTPLVDGQEWVDAGWSAATLAERTDPSLGFDPGGRPPPPLIPPLLGPPPPDTPYQYAIHVIFQTEIYGTFRQTVCFDFGDFPVLIQRLSVDSLSMIELDRLMEVRDRVLSHGAGDPEARRWSEDNCEIVEYGQGAVQLTEEEKGLLRHYPPPDPTRMNLTSCGLPVSSLESGLADPPAAAGAPFRPEVLFSKDVYVPRMHELLAVEEASMFRALSKYNVEVELELAEKFLILPAGFSSVKQAPEGTLFARMTLADSYLELSEDTAAGRSVSQP